MAAGAERARVLPSPPHRVVADYFARARRKVLVSWLVGAAALLFAWFAPHDEPDRHGVSVQVHGAMPLGLCALLFGWRVARQARTLRIVLETGESELVAVVGVRAVAPRRVGPLQRQLLGGPGSQFGQVWEFELPDPAGGPGWKRSQHFDDKQGRPFLLRGGSQALALTAHDRPGRFFVLREDLWPLELTDADKEQACARLRELDPDAGWHTGRSRKGVRLLHEQGAAIRTRWPEAKA